MDIHIGKAILEVWEKSNMSKSEFGRRINRAPQTVQHIFRKRSIDTDLLLVISQVLSYNFFTLYSIPGDKTLGTSSSKDKLVKLNASLAKENKMLNKALKDKELIIELMTKDKKPVKK